MRAPDEALLQRWDSCSRFFAIISFDRPSVKNKLNGLGEEVGGLQFRARRASRGAPRTGWN